MTEKFSRKPLPYDRVQTTLVSLEGLSQLEQVGNRSLLNSCRVLCPTENGRTFSVSLASVMTKYLFRQSSKMVPVCTPCIFLPLEFQWAWSNQVSPFQSGSKDQTGWDLQPVLSWYAWRWKPLWVLQLLGNEFYQQPHVFERVPSASYDTSAPANILTSAWWNHE